MNRLSSLFKTRNTTTWLLLFLKMKLYHANCFVKCSVTLPTWSCLFCPTTSPLPTATTELMRNYLIEAHLTLPAGLETHRQVPCGTWTLCWVSWIIPTFLLFIHNPVLFLFISIYGILFSKLPLSILPPLSGIWFLCYFRIFGFQ